MISIELVEKVPGPDQLQVNGSLPPVKKVSEAVKLKSKSSNIIDPLLFCPKQVACVIV